MLKKQRRKCGGRKTSRKKLSDNAPMARCSGPCPCQGGQSSGQIAQSNVKKNTFVFDRSHPLGKQNNEHSQKPVGLRAGF